MATDIELIHVFEDTQKQVREREDLKAATEKMLAGTRLYLRKFNAVLCPEKSRDIPIEVLQDTTFHCAWKLQQEWAGSRVAVLNFANAYSPGGGVTVGARAQEECLCRSSNLYNALTLPYLRENYYKWN